MKLSHERFAEPFGRTQSWAYARKTCRTCHHATVRHEQWKNEVIRCNLAVVDEATLEVTERKPRTLPSYAIDVWEAVCRGEKWAAPEPKRKERPAERWMREHA